MNPAALPVLRLLGLGMVLVTGMACFHVISGELALSPISAVMGGALMYLRPQGDKT